MVNVIMGLKGSGKTKRLIDLVTEAASREIGNVVCIEKGTTLTFDIPHSVRLIFAPNYDFGNGYEYLKGFISGLHAGNYDITQIFIDGLFQIAGTDSLEEAEKFLEWLESFGTKENVKFTVTVSADINLATPGIRRFF
jgi:hypothetical protein